MSNGIRTTNLERQFAIDELIGNVTDEGVEKTSRIPMASVAQQIVVSGPFTLGDGFWAATYAILAANPPADENTPGYVIDDPDPTKNGVYLPSGATWVRKRGFPDAITMLTNVGGTASAITAESKPGIDPAQVVAYILPVAQTNPGSVTLVVDGGDPLPLLDPAGSSLAPGALVAGRITMVVPNGDEYRLLSPALAVAAFDHKGTWAAPTAYTEGQVVTGSDGNWYQLKAASSTGDDPVSGGSGDWLQILVGAAISDRSLGEVKLTKRLSARVGALFDTVADMLADTALSYTDIDPGDIVEAQGFRYEVAASDATDAHVETAGGVKLYVLPGQTATNVLAFGLVADGTDIGPQLQKAFDSDIPWLHFPAGTYKLNAVSTCSRSIRLTGEPETVIDCSGGAYAILVQGSWTQISDLASDVARYVDRFPLTSATGIEPGDILVISDPTPRAWFGSAENRDYRKGEMCHVFRVDGTDVVIFGQTADSYEASKCDVYKLAPMEVEISDLYFIAGTGYALRVEMFTKYRERNVGGVTTSDRVVNIYLGYDTIIETPATQNYAYPKGGTNYTHVISNLHKYKVLAASMGSSRHALAIGGGQYLPNRYGLIVGCSLECAENGSATGAADMHGCIEFTKYVDCEIRNVGNIAGANTTYQNCDIYSPVPTIASYGSTIYGSEIAGGTLLIDGCTLHTEGDGNSFAYLNFAPIYPMREDLHIIIRDMAIISYGGGGTSAQVVGVYRDGTVNTKKINVTVDGVSGYLPNGFIAVLRARNTDGSAFQSDFLIVDNVQLQGSAGTKYLIYPEASIASVPTREMEQRGKIIHTTTAAAVNAAPDTSFKYRYSRMPAAIVGIGTANGAAMSGGLIAGKIPSPIVYSIDTDSIRPGMAATDGAAFTAGASVAMTWSAGVFEV